LENEIKEIHLVMKRLLFTLVTIHFGLIGITQSLRGEYSFNSNYRHLIDGMICSGDATYIVHSRDKFNVPWTLERTYLCKMNTQGQKEWEIAGAPPAGELFSNFGIIDDGNGGVTYLSGSSEACDYSSSFRYVLRNVNANGGINFEIIWLDNSTPFAAFVPHINGLTRDENGKYLFNYSQIYADVDSSSITIINADGTLDQILSIDQYDLTEIRFGTNYYLIGASENRLFGFDVSGTTENEIEFTENIKNFVIHNGLIYILTESVIYCYDEEFNEISSTSIPLYSLYSKLKIVNNQLQILSRLSNQYVILSLDDDLNLVANKNIDAHLPVNAQIDFNETHFAIGNYHNLHAFGSSRFRDFSLNNPNSITINRTDIGVSDITINYVTLSPASGSGTGVQNLSIFASARITNYGNYTLNSCRINYHQGMHWICGQMGYSQLHDDLNLAPGESIWIDLGQIHYETNYFGWTPPNGEFTKNICVYTSNPNGHADTEVFNDAFCKTVVYGYVGLEENVLNPQEKKLVKIVDLLGREIEYGTNQLMIYIYDDGSSEKIFVSD
jgi:hypothetical protein